MISAPFLSFYHILLFFIPEMYFVRWLKIQLSVFLAVTVPPLLHYYYYHYYCKVWQVSQYYYLYLTPINKDWRWRWSLFHLNKSQVKPGRRCTNILICLPNLLYRSSLNFFLFQKAKPRIIFENPHPNNASHTLAPFQSLSLPKTKTHSH